MAEPRAGYRAGPRVASMAGSYGWTQGWIIDWVYMAGPRAAGCMLHSFNNIDFIVQYAN